MGGEPRAPVTPGWMWGLGMGFGWLVMVAFWGVMIRIVLLFVLAAALPRSGGVATESPREILKRRYARGDRPAHL